MSMHGCVCVCKRERERERKEGWGEEGEVSIEVCEKRESKPKI